MYKQLPSEDESQRKARIAKDLRGARFNLPEVTPPPTIEPMVEKPTVVPIVEENKVKDRKKEEPKKPFKQIKKGRR